MGRALRYAVLEEQIRSNAEVWSKDYGASVDDIIAWSGMDPHSVTETAEILKLDKEKAASIMKRRRAVIRSWKKSQARTGIGDGAVAVDANKVPEFTEAVTAIRRYQLLAEKRENLQMQLGDLDLEIRRMRPVVEGLEILRRKLLEMKENYTDGNGGAK